MQDSLKNKPWFLLLMPVFLFLHIEKEYFRLIDYSNVAADISWLLTATVILIALPVLFFGYNQRSWLIAFFSLLFFYYLGPLKDFLHVKFEGRFFERYVFFLPAFIIIFFIISLILLRSRTRYNRTIVFLNILWLTFIFADLSSILIKLASGKNELVKLEGLNPDIIVPDEQKPDIYYIVFDMYTSSAALRKDFNFDNSEIENYLKSKGFRIPKNSQSNYNLTPFSIGSTLNMDYIASVDTMTTITQEKYFPGFNMVAENQVFNFFKKQGYSIHNFSSFNISDFPRMKESYDIWQTGSIIYKHNFIKKMHSDIGWHFINSDSADMPGYMKATIQHDEQVAKKLSLPVVGMKPTFVYAHFFKPHDPYTHDSSGIRSKPRTAFNVDEEKELYTAQVKYVNKMMQKITTSLLTRTKSPLVIIFQGDHGFRFSMNMEKRQMEFETFTAAYFSNKNYEMLSDEFSGVNTFRVILNSWFQQKLPILPHQTYHLKYRSYPAKSE